MIQKEAACGRQYLVGAVVMAVILSLGQQLAPRYVSATGGPVSETPPTDRLGEEVSIDAEAAVAVGPDQPVGHELLILEQLERLTAAVEHLTASVNDSNTLGRGAQIEALQAVHTAHDPPQDQAPPWADENLLVWEGEGCITPSNVPVAALCGARAGDGYVVRWIGAPGDSNAGRVADVDFMAVQPVVENATLIWSRPHWQTGELVAIHYLHRERALQLTRGGRPVYRIDRQHNYQPLGG